MLNTIRDNLSYDQETATITSGSRGEGIEMKGSDLDIMRTIRCIEVCENRDICFKHAKTYFTMETKDTKPGFTQLRLMYTDHGTPVDIFEQCEEIGNEYYFSNFKFKRKFTGCAWSTVHGPCLNDESGQYDMAYCLHSKSWITQAKHWIRRPNNSWPEDDVKQAIIKHGVLFVPIGDKGSVKEDLEWRISFSVAEKLLIYTFTHTQLLCYALMKIILKDVINKKEFLFDEKRRANSTDLLCSYFLKTIVFWVSEELPPSIWKVENLISYFMRCLKRLIYCVEYSSCPHFFIPDNNLFENKIKGLAQKKLLHQLHSLNSFGWLCIMKSKQSTNFFKSQLYLSRELSYSQVDTVKHLLFSMIHNMDCLLETCYYATGIQAIISSENSKIKYLYSYYLSKFCYKSDQFVQFNDKYDNKNMYRQYTACVSTLLRGMGHDCVSGWLMLASFFYKTKEYQKALDIIEHSLSKCTSDKLFQFKVLSDNNNELLSLQLFRKMNIVQVWKNLLLDYAVFTQNSNIIPNELQIDVETSDHLIPPVQYGHFLCFLCHYNLQNNRHCLESIINLQKTILEECFISLRIEVAICFKMLGVSLQMVGDIDSARHAYESSKRFDGKQSLNYAFKRLSSIS
ncbi:uncharacterized protein [Mytilus edulis]|uniref:uncharacterized protein n=1 Tax=Mytilus edulis TaxID=6550 RepID=UPI0039EF63B0